MAQGSQISAITPSISPSTSPISSLLPELPIELWTSVITSPTFQNRPIGEVVHDLVSMAQSSRESYRILTSEIINNFMINRLGLSLRDEDRALNWLQYLSQQASRYSTAGEEPSTLWGIRRTPLFYVGLGHESNDYYLTLAPNKVVSWPANIRRRPMALFERSSGNRNTAGVQISDSELSPTFNVTEFAGDFYGCVGSSYSRVVNLEPAASDNEPNITTFPPPVCEVGRPASFSKIDSYGRLAIFHENRMLELWNVTSQQRIGSFNTITAGTPAIALGGLLTVLGNYHQHPRVMLIGDKVYLVWETNNGPAFWQFDISNAQSIQPGNHRFPPAGAVVQQSAVPQFKEHITPNGQACALRARTPDHTDQFVDVYYGTDLQNHKTLQLNRPTTNQHRFGNTQTDMRIRPCYSISGNKICVPFSETYSRNEETGNGVSREHRYAIWNLESTSNRPIIEGELDNTFSYYRAAMENYIVAFLIKRQLPGKTQNDKIGPSNNFEHEVQVLNALTGETLWTKPLSGRGTDIVIEGGTVYVALDDSRVEVIPPPNGITQPQQNSVHPSGNVPPISNVASEDGILSPTSTTAKVCVVALIAGSVLVLAAIAYHAYRYGGRKTFTAGT